MFGCSPRNLSIAMRASGSAHHWRRGPMSRQAARICAMSGCRPGAASIQARAFSLALRPSFQWISHFGGAKAMPLVDSGQRAVTLVDGADGVEVRHPASLGKGNGDHTKRIGNDHGPGGGGGQRATPVPTRKQGDWRGVDPKSICLSWGWFGRRLMARRPSLADHSRWWPMRSRARVLRDNGAAHALHLFVLKRASLPAGQQELLVRSGAGDRPALRIPGIVPGTRPVDGCVDRVVVWTRRSAPRYGGSTC